MERVGAVDADGQGWVGTDGYGVVVVGPSVALASRISPWQQSLPASSHARALRAAEGGVT